MQNLCNLILHSNIQSQLDASTHRMKGLHVSSHAVGVLASEVAKLALELGALSVVQISHVSLDVGFVTAAISTLVTLVDVNLLHPFTGQLNVTLQEGAKLKDCTAILTLVLWFRCFRLNLRRWDELVVMATGRGLVVAVAWNRELRRNG